MASLSLQDRRGMALSPSLSLSLSIAAVQASFSSLVSVITISCAVASLYL